VQCGQLIVRRKDYETERRAAIQLEHNEKYEHHTQPIIKKSSNAILAFLEVSRRLNAEQIETVLNRWTNCPLEQIPALISQLEVNESKELGVR